ncbi:hypothetical protein VRRI112168_00370 [Vreelandella rituensis]|uniref:Uncharacterized protein n=1 Tax=Vreelandella rituensis TaxID=2282306 RepID=A0A368U9F1_9GAMM|nr:hypothetical protein [Halomonas rituensis]RCV93849.1 hypothetical protein DU506_01440 [Halomonas rituensis]
MPSSHSSLPTGITRIALLQVHAALRDADDQNPTQRLAARDWLETRDEGFVSLDSCCDYLAKGTGDLHPGLRQVMEQRAAAALGSAQASSLDTSSGWRDAVQAALSSDASTRQNFCTFLYHAQDPQLMPDMAPPEANAANPSAPSSSRNNPTL